MDKIKVFENLLNKFETEEIKSYCTDMIKEIPDYIFTIPSSTSFKYHNKTQCQPHGQIFHILMFAEVMNYILGLEYVKEKTNERQRDCLRCTPIFHDAIKCGLNGSRYTVHEHPLLAGEWVRNTNVEHDIDTETKAYIARLCESHNGEWTSTKRSKTVLPKPENDEQFFVHMCDYLASRSNLDMIYSDEVISDLCEADIQKEELPDIDTYILTFGKHNGEKLTDVAHTDPSYISWAKENITKEHYSEVRNCFNKELLEYPDWYIGAVGFLASYNGRFFDGGYAGIVYTKAGTERNYYDEAKRNLLEQIPSLDNIQFLYGDYEELYSNQNNCMFYCDIPYKGTKQYGSSKNFDYDRFWKWATKMSEKNIVLVSEHQAPFGWECIWQQEVKRTIDNNKRVKAVEKLFEIRE